MSSTENESMLGAISHVKMIPPVAAVMLSERIPIPIIGTFVLIIVVLSALLLLGVGFGLTWGWHRVFGKPELFRRTWHFFRSGVLGLSAVAWLLLTIYIVNEPVGPGSESAAVAQVRTINTAEVTYRIDHDDTYGTIPELISAGLLDTRFESSVSGYAYNVTASGIDYTVTALPVSTKTGRYGFYSGSDAVIHYARTTTETCKPCYPKGQSGAPVD